MKNLNKLGNFKIILATYFAQLNINDKVASIDYFMQEYNLGRGTIQKAIDDLEKDNSIKLKRSGRNGTTITHKDLQKLICHANVNYLNGAMPMPYTLRYEGLAASLVNYFNTNYPINFFMSYIRGANDRIELLLNDAISFAIVSKQYANHVITKYPELYIAFTLSEFTYTNNHAIIKLPTTKTIKNVGIDNNSFDHKYLIHSNFDLNNVTLINVPYHLLCDKLNSGEIDASIVNLDQKLFSEFTLTDLKDNPEITQAAFIAKKDSSIFNALIPSEKEQRYIESYMHSVLNHEILPCY